MTGQDFLVDRSRFYYEQTRFSLWKAEIFTIKGRDFHDDSLVFYDDRSRFS